MEVLLATPAVTSAATEVRTDVSTVLNLCDAALTIARARGTMNLAEIIERVRSSIAQSQKGTRHRSPSTKRCSAKRPNKAQRARQKNIAKPAALNTSMVQAPPPTRGIRASTAGKRQVVQGARMADASATEAEEEVEERPRRKGKLTAATSEPETREPATSEDERDGARLECETISQGDRGGDEGGAREEMATIELIKAVTRREKRVVEADEAAQRKRTTGAQSELSWDFSWEREKLVCKARKGAGTTSGRITRNMSKGDAASKSKTVSYTKHVYKSLSRGERMLAAARG